MPKILEKMLGVICYVVLLAVIYSDVARGGNSSPSQKILPQKRAWASLFKVDSETKIAALRAMVEHTELDTKTLNALRMVNADLAQIISRAPKYQYLASIVEDEHCQSRFIYPNHLKPPSTEEPVVYLYSSMEKTKWLTPVFPYELLNEMECLNRVIAFKIPLKIESCSNEAYKNHPQCAGYQEQDVIWAVDINHVPVTKYSMKNNTMLAKKRLLFGAILHKRNYLASYLLSRQEAHHTTEDIQVIGKEHLAAALKVGNDAMFFNLIRLLNPTYQELRKLLQLESLLYYYRDFADLAIQAWNSRNGTSYSSPPGYLLDWLFSFLSIEQHHLNLAARKTESTTLKYLIDKCKTEYDERVVNPLFIGSLRSAALSENTNNLRILLDEITDYSAVHEHVKLSLISAALGSDDFVEIMNLLLQKVELKLPVHTLIQAMLNSSDMNKINWVIDHLEWTNEDINYLLGRAQDKAIILEKVRNTLMKRRES